MNLLNKLIHTTMKNVMKTAQFLVCSMVVGTTLSFTLLSEKAISPENEKSKKNNIEFENIEFDFDRAALRNTSIEELDRLIDELQGNPVAVKLSGHADSIGEYVYNWHLSKSRADEVKAYLISKGIEETKIASTEYGNTKPIASNTTEEGRQRNRRVEIELVQ